MGNPTALAGERLGAFARTGQLSLKSGEGAVDVQAQNGSMRLFAEEATLGARQVIFPLGKNVSRYRWRKLSATWGREDRVWYDSDVSAQVKRTMAASIALKLHRPAIPYRLR